MFCLVFIIYLFANDFTAFLAENLDIKVLQQIKIKGKNTQISSYFLSSQ